MDNETTSSDLNADSLSDMDFSSMMAYMDLNFNVTLPYSAKSNNASTANNDNKNLSWNLSSAQAVDIEFEFDLYNMTTIYIGLGVIALLIIIVVVFIVNKKKSNGNVADLAQQSINTQSMQPQQLNESQTVMNQEVTQPSQQQIFMIQNEQSYTENQMNVQNNNDGNPSNMGQM